MRTQSEWKVQTVISFPAALLTISATRSRISLAALLVKVTARIFSGAIPRSTIWEIRQVTVRVLPVPAPAKINTGPSSALTASAWAALRLENSKAMKLDER